MPVRQEVVNVVLAQILQEHGLVAAPEQILKRPLEAVRLPDVLVDFQGLRLAIEAEFSNTPSARDIARDKAQERVEQAIAHVGVAVVYPAKLRGLSFDRLKHELDNANLQFLILTEAVVTQAQLFLFPTGQKPAFTKGKIRDLVTALRRSYEQLVKDETVQRAVELIESGIEHLLFSLASQPAATDRLAQALGIGDWPSPGSPKGIRPEQRAAVNRIAGLILVNAMVFHEVLSKGDRRVQSLGDIRKGLDVVGEILNRWRFILEEINYYPIFFMACEVLKSFSPDRDLWSALFNLQERARVIVGWKAALRHDLAGRIYHRILEEAKYLGAYYTAIPSAALLLKLALRADSYSLDWSDLAEAQAFRISDLACGTGTLLMAAADTVVDNHVHQCVSKAKNLDLVALQRALVEKVIYGYDVLPSAVHLTASTLALRVPDMPVDVTHLYKMPLGGAKNSLGSLEFLERDLATATLFGMSDELPEQVVGKGKLAKGSAKIPDLDLCVMNPPFTRSVGGNLLFGNLPEKERQGMQAKLKRIVESQKLSASITAGLGSVFVALADRHIKEGGRLALVLPRTLVSGVSWEPTRKLVAERYQLEYLVVSHQPDHWNFSENTSLSEVLTVARKLAKGQKPSDEAVVCVNLWRQPRTAIEALSLAASICSNNIPDLQTGQGALELSIGDTKYGEVVSLPWPELRKESWGLPCAFAQADLIRAFHHLRRGRLYLPAIGMRGRVPLCPLEAMGELGYDCRDMHDGFDVSAGRTAYAALWNHEASRLTTMNQAPNKWLKPLNQPKPGRPLRAAQHLWAKAGRLLLAERLRLNTMRLNSLLADEKVVSNVWWTVILQDGRRSDDWQKSLVLWLNSTLGLLMYVGHREETEGAWVKFKKPVLGKMPVLDLHKIQTEGRKRLAEAYDKLADQPLGRFPEMDKDEVRAAIDDAISDCLGLPSLAPLRRLLAREPVICVSLQGLNHASPRLPGQLC